MKAMQAYDPSTQLKLKSKDAVIHFDEGLIGFSECKDFILMENAMAKIGEPCKSLLDAYYIQKKSMLDIAADFGYTNADNAKTQKYKCLIRLKKLFFAQYKNV